MTMSGHSFQNRDCCLTPWPHLKLLKTLISLSHDTIDRGACPKQALYTPTGSGKQIVTHEKWRPTRIGHDPFFV